MHILTRIPPPPPSRVAMHYWRLGVVEFLPAKDAYIFCRRCRIAISPSDPAPHLSIPPPVLHDKKKYINKKCCRAGLDYKCYLDLDETTGCALSKAQAGPLPPSLLANVKARNKAGLLCFFVFFFLRSKEAVSESSSSSACIPSISHTASWTRIRRQIPTVIREQQRSCYIV